MGLSRSGSRLFLLRGSEVVEGVLNASQSLISRLFEIQSLFAYLKSGVQVVGELLPPRILNWF